MSNMELFKKIVNASIPFLIFAKSSILDIWLSPEYVFTAKRVAGKNCASAFNGIKVSKYNKHIDDYSKM